MPFKYRGVWCSPDDFEMNRDSVCRFLDTLANAGINHAFMHVKNGNGEVFWPCEFKPEITEETVGDFDLPQVLQEEAQSARNKTPRLVHQLLRRPQRPGLQAASPMGHAQRRRRHNRHRGFARRKILRKPGCVPRNARATPING